MMDWLQDAHNWVAISFVLFCILAWVLGRKPVAAKLDARIVQIRKDIDTAESLRAEAQSLLDQYKLKSREAETESRRIVDNARKHAEEILHAGEADLAEAAKRRELYMQERLKRLEDSAINEIRAYAADLAVKATAELIAAHMDDQTNARLIDEAIRDLAKDAA
jgi:F-type H+-transporting ATPase subunit b